ncbi:CheR family methyltransferase [Agaribacter flavus]|uniref:protein-glutamate O-methyltransferase n=1 Tax=Agaribacter flavus TaxID=1902781 RepID=A0ABV7FTP5_9ALTE
MQNEISERAYSDFAAFLKNKLGITLGENKQYLAKSRLSIAMREFDFDDVNKFIEAILRGHNRSMVERALESMTTNETFWFRDVYPFENLKQSILPKIAKTKRSIRIWSAACSHGQEAYSIAMTLLEYNRLNPSLAFTNMEILASDISDAVLNTAKAGIYDELSVSRGLSAEMKSKYFSHNADNTWTIKPEVKRLVTFKKQNLLESYSSQGSFDLVFCRNVLIYFDDKDKANILQKISAQLPVGGIVVLGAAESIPSKQDNFKMEKLPQGLYYVKQ